jgi:tRNA(fMet)-specific endonuclease VapC
MVIRYLLDTNIASYVIKGNSPRVRAYLSRIPANEIGVSVVTEAELRFGANRLPEAARIRKAVDEFLQGIDVLAWDSAAAKQYARVRSVLELSGTAMGNLDLMIAAHALSIEATLVTHDRVFRHVKGLQTEDWN